MASARSRPREHPPPPQCGQRSCRSGTCPHVSDLEVVAAREHPRSLARRCANGRAAMARWRRPGRFASLGASGTGWSAGVGGSAATPALGLTVPVVAVRKTSAPEDLVAAVVSSVSRTARRVAEYHVVRSAPGPYPDQLQVGLGHSGEDMMVSCHDLGADHQVKFVDQSVGQQIGPEGPGTPRSPHLTNDLFPM